MEKHELQQAALRLPPEDRLEIADSLYSSLDPEPLTDWQGELLDKRVREADRQPERFTPWEEARERLARGGRRDSDDV
ncbi:MAG: addiction module protein [Holophagales bacterium]|nr:addiction module protein [Holophagales bacterium]